MTFLYSFIFAFSVELSEERPRTVCSGLVKHIPLEQMQVKLAVVGQM